MVGLGGRETGGDVHVEETPMEAIEEMSFERAIVELESVVQKLEGEGLSLSETEALYQRGRALSVHCQSLLEAVSLRVEELGQGENDATPVPFATESDR